MKGLRISALCLFGVLGLANLASAQIWSRRYNGSGSGNDSARSIALDGAGNTIVTGESDGTAATKVDFVTIKYNGSGTPLWSKRYDGTAHGNDYAKAVATDIAGNVYVTGSSEGLGTDSDIVTIKYSPTGVRLWVKRYDGPAHGMDTPSSIAVDQYDGTIYVAGGSQGVGTEFDTVLIKYNPDGTRPWLKRFDGSAHGYDFASAVAVDPAHNVYITGATTGTTTDIDFLTIKYSPTGTRLWVRRYNSPANGVDFSNAIAVDDSGEAYITGNSWRSDVESHYVTIKYNTAGTQQWIADYNHAMGTDIPWGIAVDPSGNAIVTGESYDPTTQIDCATIKYNGMDGSTIWTQRYDGGVGGDDIGYAIALDANGDPSITGSTYTGDKEKTDILTIKYLDSGFMAWRKTFAGTGHRGDAGYAVAADPFGNTYVAGLVCTVGLPTLTLVDFVTIKYAP